MAVFPYVAGILPLGLLCQGYNALLDCIPRCTAAQAAKRLIKERTQIWQPKSLRRK